MGRPKWETNIVFISLGLRQIQRNGCPWFTLARRLLNGEWVADACASRMIWC